MAHETFAPWAEKVEGVGPLAAKELLAMGDAAQACELVDGMLVKKPPTGFQHGNVSAELTFALQAYVKPRVSGRVTAAETGYILSEPG